MMKVLEMLEITGVAVVPIITAMGMWLNSKFASAEKKIDKEIQNLQQNHNLIFLDMKEDIRQMNNQIKTLEAENKMLNERIVNLLMEQAQLKHKMAFVYKIFQEHTKPR